MPLPSSITISVLNVKIHPHTTELYVNLLKLSCDKHLLGKVRGNDFVLLGWCKSITLEKPELGLYGELYKFLNIDPRQPWLNMINVTPFDIDENTPMPVPENLKPNLRKIPFCFFPKKHRFAYDIAHLTPNGAQKVLNSIFNRPLINEKFGYVDVEIETSQEGVEEVLSVPNKHKIIIDLTLPNPDEVGGAEKDVMDRLIEARVRKEHVEQSSDNPQGIDPDIYTKARISLSKSN